MSKLQKIELKYSLPGQAVRDGFVFGLAPRFGWGLLSSVLLVVVVGLLL